jgi:hypothetical protein
MRAFSRTACLALACILVSLPAGGVWAQDAAGLPPGFASVAPPEGLSAETADLVLRGRIGRPEPLLLDLKTIMAFPQASFTTIDPWDGKEHRFTGVSLAGLLAWAGIEPGASSLALTARNKYSIPIKREDYEKRGYIVAWAMDGQAFSAESATRKRGPLAIAIDFSRNKDLPVELYKHQLLWQLADIQVK